MGSILPGMIHIIISIIAFIISAIFNSQMDRIMIYQKSSEKSKDSAKKYCWSKSRFWLEINHTKSWLKLYVFSFIRDGWHFCKAVRIITILVPFTYLIIITFNLPSWTFAAVEIAAYAIEGIFFEIGYGL